jgi:RNA polymerase sigma-70 factor (ECF subfamily)
VVGPPGEGSQARKRSAGSVDRPSEEQIAAWYPRLLRTAMRLTGNSEDAADATQQAFCKALGRWDQFDGRCQPATWIHGILLNCIRDRMRRRSPPIVEGLSEWAIANAAACEDRQVDRLGRQEQLRRLRTAIEALPDKLRLAFVAAVLDGYTYQEVAEMLSTPVGTVAYRVYQARRKLRSVMLESFPET